MRSEEEKSAELLRCGGAVLSRPQVPWKLLRGGFSRIEASVGTPHFDCGGGAAPELIRRRLSGSYTIPSNRRKGTIREIY